MSDTPTCRTTGKITYPTSQAAWHAADAIKRRNREGVANGTKRRTTSQGYRCPFCHFWHITSRVGGETK